LRQRSDSGAEWQHSPSGNTYRLGRDIITFQLTDTSTQSTSYVYLVESGVVTAIYCTQSGAITTEDATIAMSRSIDITGKGGTSLTEQTAFVKLTVAASGAAAGTLDSSTGLTQSVTAGEYLNVGTDGQSDTLSAVTCRVVLDTNS